MNNLCDYNMQEEEKILKKIVITGATSFIGIHLINEWVKEACKIYAVVRPNSKNIGRITQNPKISIIECDIDKYDHLSRYIDSADYFYHLAWEGARLPYRNDEIIQKHNYECSLNATKAAKELGCKFFLGSGSQAEYGKMLDNVNEETICSPNTPYGIEKLHSCNDISVLAERFGIRYVWVRIFSIYGQYDYKGTLIMSSLRKMLKNESIEMTECTQQWDYLHVKDAAKVMHLFATSNCESGIYNLASGDNKQLKKYILEMKKVLESKSILKFGTIPYGEDGPINLIPNSDKMKKALKWKPEISFSDGIRQLGKSNIE